MHSIRRSPTVEERELGLQFDPQAGTWALLGEAAETVKLTIGRQQTLKALDWFGEPVSASRLARHLKMPRETMLKRLQRLRDDGYVSGSDKGWFRCPLSTLSADTVDTVDTQDTEDREDTTKLFHPWPDEKRGGSGRPLRMT